MEKITLNISASSREEYRYKLISEFLKESHGTLGHVTEYLYYVDTLEDGNRVYLKRPTQLNKGVDFEVRVENMHFRYGKHGNHISTGNRPSHSDIHKDLINKVKEQSVDSKRIKDIIDRIYKCQEITDEELRSFNFSSGFPFEAIMKSLKWLFVEQDITYWNRSGREMLYKGLCKIWE